MFQSSFLNLAVTVCIGIAGGYAGMKTKLPAATMLGATIAVVAYKMLFNLEINLPRNFNFISQVFVGILIAASYNSETFARLVHLVPAMLVSCISLIAVGLFTAFVISKLGILDFPTAYISTSPGSMNVLVAVSGDMHADAALVASFHFLRILFVSITAPLIFKWAIAHHL